MQRFDTTRALRVLPLVLGTALLFFALVSCSDNPVGASFNNPLEVTGVYEHVHADSLEDPEDLPVPEVISPGDTIAIRGQNMNSVAELYFVGFEADFNHSIASNKYLVVQVPGTLPFGEIETSALDSLASVRVANQSSEASFDDIPLLPPAPNLQRMSNEYADPGEEVTFGGSYLYLPESITLPGGTTIPSDQIEATPEGGEATFTIPESATETDGPIEYTTAAGVSESLPSFRFHDMRGMLLNMDRYSSWGGWSAMASSDAGSELQSAFNPGAEGDYLIMKADGEIGAGNGNWWEGNRTIQLNDQQWVAPENLDESPENFAVKFELNIRQAWDVGSVQLYLLNTANDGYGSGYAYRLRPWLQSDGSASAASWNGWRTFTIPLSQFRTSAGASDGSTPSSLTDLFDDQGRVGSGGPDGNPTAFRLVNYSERVVPAGQAFAIDNFRVVQIAE